jgi:hypothetical protein
MVFRCLIQAYIPEALHALGSQIRWRKNGLSLFQAPRPRSARKKFVGPSDRSSGKVARAASLVKSPDVKKFKPAEAS